MVPVDSALTRFSEGEERGLGHALCAVPSLLLSNRLSFLGFPLFSPRRFPLFRSRGRKLIHGKEGALQNLLQKLLLLRVDLQGLLQDPEEFQKLPA